MYEPQSTVARRSSHAPRWSDSTGDEQRIEVGRYIEALRRGWPLVLLLCIVGTIAALGTSLLTPATYRATARIVVDDPVAPTDTSQMERRLATIQQLLTTRRVLDAAADDLDGFTPEELSSRVDSAVDSEANIINVEASARSADVAAAIANAVANAFIVDQVDRARERLARARVALLEELDQVSTTAGREAEAQAIRDRLSALAVAEASAGTEFVLADPAQPPDQRFSPRPLRNSILAFLASLFLAVLVVVGREQLRPRLSGARELSRLTGLPILAGVPKIAGLRGRRSVVRAMEREGYQTLQTLVTFQLPPGSPRSILMTSAVHEEGKTRAATGLARALARSGHRTLLVSADVRWPTLHKEFGVAVRPGLSDVLSGSAGATKGRLETVRAAHRTGGAVRERGFLEILPSGQTPEEPAQLFAPAAIDAFMAAAGEAGFAYVVLDGPPIVGIADSQVLAPQCDGVVVASRVDRLDIETAIELRETFERLGVEPVGIIAVGVRAAMSPYFLRPRVAPETASARPPRRSAPDS